MYASHSVFHVLLVAVRENSKTSMLLFFVDVFAYAVRGLKKSSAIPERRRLRFDCTFKCSASTCMQVFTQYPPHSNASKKVYGQSKVCMLRGYMSRIRPVCGLYDFSNSIYNKNNYVQLQPTLMTRSYNAKLLRTSKFTQKHTLIPPRMAL